MPQPLKLKHHHNTTILSFSLTLFQNLIFGGLSNEITINNTPKINKISPKTLFSVLIKPPYLSHFLFLNNSYSFSLIRGSEKLEKN